MAGANIRDIRNRINSVESTKQLTKAMQLVAVSKLRRVKERADTIRPYFDALNHTFEELAAQTTQNDAASVYTSHREVKKVCILTIAGDRGMAGGYNANIFRTFEQMSAETPVAIFPIGKRAVERYTGKDVTILSDNYTNVEEVTMENCVEIADYLCSAYVAGEFDELYMLHTKLTSMLVQTATTTRLLPIAPPQKEQAETEAAAKTPQALALFEPSGEVVFNEVVPRYLTGVIFGAVCDSLASELAARRNAMEAATDNAQEIIDTLSLQYNHARQGAITQEITEIVSGAQAMG